MKSVSNWAHLWWWTIMCMLYGNHCSIIRSHKYKLPLWLTAKAIKLKLALENPNVLEQLRVNKYDRKYQIWKREPLSIELFTEKAFLQKLEYIHQNPVAAGLVNFAEEYKYSSAKFYLEGRDEFNMITHYSGNWLICCSFFDVYVLPLAESQTAATV